MDCKHVIKAEDFPKTVMLSAGPPACPWCEIERLTAAIKWALGEGPGRDGLHFGDEKPDPAPPYWWRKPLRQLAGMGDLAYDKSRRTVVSGATQQSQARRDE